MRYRFAAAALLLSTHAAVPASLELAVKAAYLDKFLAFVEWPQSSFPAADSPIDICIVGRNPFGRLVDHIVAGQRVGGRPIVVRYLSEVSARSACHLAYLGRPAAQSISQEIEILRYRPVLTVTDWSAGPTDKGIINLVVDNNRVRFEVDERAAEQSHIGISSKLLDLELHRQTDN
ncbi:MAG TPA: YfiR family protein [Rhizomicrobium sp.]|nr:YfiR family protein [Rhizomicrobium sp.]